MEYSTSEEETLVLHASHWFIVVLYIVSLTTATIYLHNYLPGPLAPSSELRARRLLFELSNIGPKPAGAETCERLTRNLILDELKLIKLSATVQFEIDKQNPSGCFDLERFSTDGITICYRNIFFCLLLGRLVSANDFYECIFRFQMLSSVCLKATTSKKGSLYYSIVITIVGRQVLRVSFGTGGSDDLISCALMMELIRLLARQPDMLTKYDVVFLFNGAEESILQGAHGFITQHRWRDDIRAFINLEASGSGGRELLFQAGPSNQWLLNSYLAAAVYPHCSIIAQEIFQSGLFPGDTDFRVFRDYGKIPGDNVYATLLYLLQSPYLNSSILHDIQKYVFFDVLGLFVVVYPETVANSIHAVLIIAVLLKVSTHFFHYAEYYKDAIADYIVVIATMGIVDHATAIENVHQLLIAIILTHVNRALHKKDGSALVRDSGLYVIAKDYRGVEDIPFVDESEFW
uniref:FXNA-like protease n=1 Tax=Angiostrongylus cantonensis TaxID=6313 RepID=A0A158P7I7_ANGCA